MTTKSKVGEVKALSMVRMMLAAGQRVNGATLAKAMDCAQPQASLYLRALEKQGVLKRTGRGALVQFVSAKEALSGSAPASPPESMRPVNSAQNRPTAGTRLAEDVLRDMPLIDNGSAPADMETALSWFQANGGRLKRNRDAWTVDGTAISSVKELVEGINARRLTLKLPPFSLSGRKRPMALPRLEDLASWWPQAVVGSTTVNQA